MNESVLKMRSKITLLIVLTGVCVVTGHNSKFSGLLQDLVDQNLDIMDITDKCEEHMVIIRNGLRDREIWALKMLDASSHIGRDFIWGNNILIGSPRSCNLISNPVKIKFAWDHVPVGIANLTQIKAPIRVAYRSMHARHWSEMQVDLSTLEQNVLNFGFCLPLSCSNVDSFRLLESILQNKSFVDRSLIGMNTQVIHTKILQLRDNFLINPFVTAFFVILYSVLFLMTLEFGYSLIQKLNSCIFPPDMTANEKKKKDQFFEQILSCFSISGNTKIIMSKEIGNESIEVLHGIRVIGMFFFIVGHVVIFGRSSVTNIQMILVYAEKIWLLPLYTLHLTLDTFFVLSGMVLSYIFFQNLKKKPIKSRIPFFMRMVANRYLRLTPAYVISLLLTVVITKLVKDLSPYYLLDDDEMKCERNWWRNIIYINNLFPLKDSCMMWGWFLGADFQCFFISAALLLVYEKHNKVGLTLFFGILLGSSAVTAYYGYILGFGLTKDSLYKTVDHLYTPFWVRIGAYFTGVYAGHFLSVNNRTLNLSKKWITLGWILGPGVIFTLVFSHMKLDISPLTAMMFTGLSRTAWGLGTVWIIIACSTGNGGFVNRMLSAKWFLPFSRMTYSAYLVNPILILFVTMLNEVPYTIDFPMLPVISLGFATTIYGLAFIYMLLFENPFIRLVKVLTS